MTDVQRSPASHPVRRIAALLVVAALCVLAVPYVLTLVYIAVNPVSTPMLWRWATGARVERAWVPIEAMSGALPLAVVVAEDSQFCRHRGLDLKALREAIEEADEFSEARGGSTITQQTAKNLFLWSGRSLVRKALEAPLALWIDLVMSKRRIMEIYLNIAEWGPGGEFGAEAGAQWAFRKSVRELNPREAAAMASILPNPKRRSAKAPGAGVRRLAGIYVARAAKSPRVAACLQRKR